MTNFTYWYPRSRPPNRFPSDYRELSHSPFKPYTPMSGAAYISPALFAMAALETGYGKSNNWSDFTHFPRAERKALGEFLVRRLEWIMSSTILDGGEMIPPFFTRLIEVSEWGSLSYYLGQIGARLGAEVWLNGNVKRALHYGIYTSDAYVKIGATIRAVVKPGAEKTPDLLVEDMSGQWHLFEAKGGGAGYRTKAVNKGLEQLDAVSAVGPSGACIAPKSCVCAFTTVTRPEPHPRHIAPLSIDLVDPPPDEAVNDRVNGEGGIGGMLLIMPDVSHLRSVVLDRLVLDELPYPQSHPPFNLPGFNLRTLGSGRVHALVPSSSAWKEPALQALDTFGRIMKMFNDYAAKPPTRMAEVIPVSVAARELLQLASQLLQQHPAAIETLTTMTNDKTVISDPSGFGLALSRALQVDRLTEESDFERVAMLDAVTTHLDREEWHIVALRCGAVFVSPRTKAQVRD